MLHEYGSLLRFDASVSPTTLSAIRIMCDSRFHGGDAAAVVAAVPPDGTTSAPLLSPLDLQISVQKTIQVLCTSIQFLRSSDSVDGSRSKMPMPTFCLEHHALVMPSSSDGAISGHAAMIQCQARHADFMISSSTSMRGTHARSCSGASAWDSSRSATHDAARSRMLSQMTFAGAPLSTLAIRSLVRCCST